MLLSFFLFLVYSLLPLSLSSPVSELNSLLSIKSSVFDPNLSLQNWTENNPSYCSWSYVKCDSRNQTVSLNISNLNLSGKIPPEISNLRSLVYLNLSNNIFNQSFPYRVSTLKHLTDLDLYNNNLTGRLPLEISTMPNLKHLHLGGNFFNGSIPTEYGNFKKLEYLAVSGNELSGFIPKEIGNLKFLKELYLGYYNAYSGGIPKEFGNLSSLLRFDAADCGLSGEIPNEIGNLKNLDSLFLQVNAFTGELTEDIGNLSSLKSLDLSNNMFYGQVPKSFSKLKNITLLNLFRNKLHGMIPEFIGDLPKLEVLQLWENNFTGSIPKNLGRNGKLQLLDLSTNKLSGSLPSDLCYGNKLQTLIALQNFLFGSIPESLGKCESLSRIRMGENFLNGSIPNGLFSLPNLIQIELQDNLLTGGIPQTKNNRISLNLGQISLSNNRLSGPLPASIGDFSALQKLVINNNLFSGKIPTEVGRLQQISKLDFSGNNFSGEIPPEISKCKLLTFVDLSRNRLSGNIPIEITSMKILNYLNISRNHLQGKLPPLISSMQSLTSVDFSYNNLSGMVPVTGQFSYFNATSFLGNPNLCGPYLGPCKTEFTNDSKTNHTKSAFSAAFKLLLVIGLLACSIAFAIAAIIKARALKKASEARAWKLTAFQRLDFTCDDVLDCLKEENIIGKGGAGIVYKGTMPNGGHVAVKRLPAMTRGSSHDHGFSAEIQTLGRIRHRHIVRLLGFCSNYDTNLLVYEYMPNGSLGEVLHGKKGGFLNWDTRYKIAVESAKGLCYLHHDCSPLILHRDVKSNNILLDSGFEAHVADFGLAKFLQDSGTSECMSAIAGSYGYIAPGIPLVTQQLSSTNYNTWSRNVYTALSAKNKLGILNGSIKRPSDSDSSFASWERCNAMVKAWLLSSLSPEILSSVVYVSDAAEIWMELRDRFAQSNDPRIFQLRRDIALCTQENLSVADYFTKLKSLWDELNSLIVLPSCTCGCLKQFQDLSSQEKLNQFLMGLSESFNNSRNQILMMNPLPNVNKAYSLIQSEEQQRLIRDASTSNLTDSLAMAAFHPHGGHSSSKSGVQSGNSTSRKGRPFCDHCKANGHYVEKCFKLHGYPPNHRLPKRQSTNSNLTSTSQNESLTPDQISQLLQLLKAGNHQASVNMAGSVNEEEDWSG